MRKLKGKKRVLFPQYNEIAEEKIQPEEVEYIEIPIKEERVHFTPEDFEENDSERTIVEHPKETIRLTIITRISYGEKD